MHSCHYVREWVRQSDLGSHQDQKTIVLFITVRDMKVGMGWMETERGTKNRKDNFLKMQSALCNKREGSGV